MAAQNIPTIDWRVEIASEEGRKRSGVTGRLIRPQYLFTPTFPKRSSTHGLFSQTPRILPAGHDVKGFCEAPRLAPKCSHPFNGGCSPGTPLELVLRNEETFRTSMDAVVSKVLGSLSF